MYYAYMSLGRDERATGHVDEAAYIEGWHKRLGPDAIHELGYYTVRRLVPPMHRPPYANSSNAIARKILDYDDRGKLVKLEFYYGPGKLRDTRLLQLSPEAVLVVPRHPSSLDAEPPGGAEYGYILGTADMDETSDAVLFQDIAERFRWTARQDNEYE
jgi:hypothetical protein